MTNIAEASEALLLRGEHIISILLRSTSPQARMHSPRAHIYDCQPARTRTCRTCRTCTSLSLTPTHIAITSSGSISGSGALAAAAAVAAAADSGAAAAPSRSHAFAAKSSRRVGLPDERRCDSVATSADATKGRRRFVRHTHGWLPSRRSSPLPSPLPSPSLSRSPSRPPVGRPLLRLVLYGTGTDVAYGPGCH
jgi:hypothetical protein